MHCSFHISLYRGELPSLTAPKITPREKRTNVRNPSVKHTPLRAETTKNTLQSLNDNIRVIVELYKDNKLLYKGEGFNSVVIKNIILEGVPYIPPETDTKKIKKLEKDKDKDKSN